MQGVLLTSELPYKQKETYKAAGLLVGFSFHHKGFVKISRLGPFHQAMKRCRLVLLMKRK